MSMNLAYTVFRPETEVKAALFVIHGMQEHKERYTSFAKYLNEQGIGVVTYDLPGHGETSKGSERGWFGDHDGWNNLVLSAVEIAQLTRKEFPDVPLVCFGHSMGTMIGRCFLQRYDSLIDAAIFSGAPAYVGAARAGVALANTISAIRGKKGHSKTLDKLATGSFSKAVKNPRTPLDWLSVNTENVDRYIADPDCGFPFTCRGYHDLFAGMVQMNNVSLYRCTKISSRVKRTLASAVKRALLPVWKPSARQATAGSIPNCIRDCVMRRSMKRKTQRSWPMCQPGFSHISDSHNILNTGLPHILMRKPFCMLFMYAGQMI